MKKMKKMKKKILRFFFVCMWWRGEGVFTGDTELLILKIAKKNLVNMELLTLKIAKINSVNIC